MGRYVGIPVLICSLSVIAVVIYKFCGRKDARNAKDIFIFYAIILYVGISLVKTVLGEADRGIFDSFYDLEAVTYAHYGIPLLLVVVIAASFHGKFLRGESCRRFVQMFDSLFVFAVMSEFLICGTIYNVYCVMTAVFSATVSLLICIFYKGRIAYFDKNRIKERLLLVLPGIGLWAVTVVLYEPNQLILNNLRVFQIPYFQFLCVTVSAAFLMVFIYTLFGVIVLSDRQLRLFGQLLSGISLAGYIQGNFMNGEMDVMDGTVQGWSMSVKLFNAAVWIAVILVFVLLDHRFGKGCRLLSVYLCLIQIVSLTYMVISVDFPSGEEKFVLTTDHALELNSKKNVVVFVLDWFDRQVMDEILEKDPGFDKDLKDFICYRNASSCYAFTAQSVPYMLTHVGWKDAMNEEQYIEYAYENGSLLTDIVEQGYSVGVYTDAGYVAKPATELLVNYSDDIRIRLGYIRTVSVMSRTSKYKMAPFAAKKAFHYMTSDINEIVVDSGIWNTNNDVVFYEMLGNDGLSVVREDGLEGAFRFFHMKGAHSLFTMDDECRKIAGDGGNRISQSMGALRIVYKYIENMKRLGVYDEAAIIITADHGQNTHVGREASDPYDCDLTSSPILYVKLPNEHGDKVQYSDAPVSHTEFAATIMNVVGGDSERYGRTFSQIPEGERRERIFTLIDTESKGKIKKFQKWKISGDVNDFASWELIQEEIY